MLQLRMKLLLGFFFYLILPHSQSFFSEKSKDIQWTAKWIGAPKNLQLAALNNLSVTDNEIFKSLPGLKPALVFRKSFQIEQPVSKAILYCTAKGSFKAYLTTEWPLGFRDYFPILAPGWTDYNKTIQYYTFDVTHTLQDRFNNTIGMVIGSGWYSGYIGEKYSLYGNEESALVELHITFENGSTTVIKSDETWKVNTGEILYSDLVHGELFYENRKLYNWNNYNYSDTNWSPVITHLTNENFKLVEDTSPIQRFRANNAKSYWQVGEKTWIYMFDRLLYGGVILTVSYFPFSARIQVRFGESVYSNGSLYSGNYKTGTAVDTYVLNDVDNRPEVMNLEPMFTSHSFKFVEISGYPVAFYLSEVTAFEYTQNHVSYSFAVDNKLISGIAQCIGNSMETNLISIPTNSPLGDTRVGWLEPAGLFAPTAFYFNDARQFYKKWLRDIRDSQAPSGAYSNTAPNVNDLGDASPGSGFAPIIVSYNFYKFYEDRDTLEENYISNQKWIDYVLSNNPNFLYTKTINKDYGDYANVNAETPKEVIATAYFAYGTLLMSKMAKVLNKPADQKYYFDLHKNIGEAFVKAYVNSSDGKVNGDTQTGYVLALVSKILSEEMIPNVVQKLVDNIKQQNYHLTTGYVGTAFILPVLAEHGHVDVAYRILLQDSFPSWGYMLKNETRLGLWERWDSWTEEEGFQGSSLNGQGLGSVGSFLFQYIGGINSNEEDISFKQVVIKPYIGEGINYFDGTVETNYGSIRSYWRINGNVINIEVDIPRNTSGKLILPFAGQTWVRELNPGENKFQFNIIKN